MTIEDRVISFEDEASPAIYSLSRLPQDVSKDTAIVVDLGGSLCRAGYSSSHAKGPSMAFEPIVHRYQPKQTASGTVAWQVGGSAPPSWRISSKSPFVENGLLLNVDALERILDHVFEGLDIADERVDHGVLMTESIANVPAARKPITELFFEAYGVPKVSYGIDALFSYFFNHTTLAPNSLIISFGHAAVHVIAKIGGTINFTDGTSVKRINYGGVTASQYLLKLLQVKYPLFPHKMTIDQSSRVMSRACYVAQNYCRELMEMSKEEGLRDRDVTIQFGWPRETKIEIEEKEREREKLMKRRKENVDRLKERAERMKEEKLALKSGLVESFKSLLRKVSLEASGDDGDGDEDEVSEELRLHGFESRQECEEALRAAEEDLRQYKNKLAGIEEPRSVDTRDYSILAIPDAELDPEQLKQKRRLRLIKNSAEARERIRIEKERKELLKKQKEAEQEQLRIEHFDEWKSQMYKKREIVMDRLKERQKMKEALADRRSTAVAGRLKSITSLVQDVEATSPDNIVASTRRRKAISKKAGSANLDVDDPNDTFGADDADWMIYREISKQEEDEEDEDELDQKLLSSIEEQLEMHDLGFLDLLAAEMAESVTVLDLLRNGPTTMDTAADKALSPATAENERAARSAHQLHLNTERVRVGEVVFQPSLAGIDQAGLAEVLADLLLRSPSITAENLPEITRNIFLTGAFSRMPGLGERIEKELMAFLPTNTPIKIRLASDARMDGWRGAAKAADHDKISWIEKSVYEEFGSDRIICDWYTNPA